MNSKGLLLQQVQKLCSEKSAYELLEILANEICPPDADSRSCEDSCVDCWLKWLKPKLNEVRQNDK